MTMQHCDDFFWGCIWNYHSEYGQPSKVVNQSGGWYLAGSWVVPHSGNGYMVYCDHFTHWGDGSTAETWTTSQQFKV
jgi:hypothetical protein